MNARASIISSHRLPARGPRARHAGCGRAKTSAFSLIELLVVISILAVAIATVGACLGAGMRVWEVAQTYGRAENEALMALDQMSRDLRNAVECATLEANGVPLAFRGEAGEMRFAGVVVSTDPPDSQLAVIHYRWNSGDEQLIRETTAYPEGLPQASSWADHVRGLRFSYATGTSVEGMDVATGMPTRVDIELQMDTGAQGAPTLVVRRSVQLPTAQATAGTGE